MSTKSIAWDSGGGYIRLTYTGSGNGTISVESDVNNLGTSRSKTITVETTQGGVITKNLTINQAACPFPVGDIKNFSYTGSVQSVLLPAGSYKLQCWGAQGGSNAADSSYGITAQAGGKGGYSVGQLTISQATDVRVYVGGQGSSSGTGGFNGGGATNGSISSEEGVYTRRGRSASGGGGTDIRLSDGSLYSRMIVAGGGSGGAMSYLGTKNSSSISVTEYSRGTYRSSWSGWTHAVDGTIYLQQYKIQGNPLSEGDILRITINPIAENTEWALLKLNEAGTDVDYTIISSSANNTYNKTVKTVEIPASAVGNTLNLNVNSDVGYSAAKVVISVKHNS